MFGDNWPKISNAWMAIAAYERTLVQRDTPLDNYLNGDENALTDEQLEGKELFEGKAGCVQCHNGALASDQKYYNIGVAPLERWEEDALAQITFRYELYAKAQRKKCTVKPRQTRAFTSAATACHEGQVPYAVAALYQVYRAVYA